jgi:hypothetical protein
LPLARVNWTDAETAAGTDPDAAATRAPPEAGATTVPARKMVPSVVWLNRTTGAMHPLLHTRQVRQWAGKSPDIVRTVYVSLV